MIKTEDSHFELDAQGSFDPDNRNITDALTYYNSKV